MAVAFDAISDGGYSVAARGVAKTWTHTPAGTPKGAFVLLFSPDGNFDPGMKIALAASYGGTAMQHVATVYNSSGGEPITVELWALTAGLAAGAQTVSVTRSTSSNVKFNCMTVTATGDTTVFNWQPYSNDAVANPSFTLRLHSITCFVAELLGSGQDAIAGITPPAGWTDRGEYDAGARTTGIYSYNTVSNADVTCGWTQTSENAAAIAFAIAESSAGKVLRVEGAGAEIESSREIDQVTSAGAYTELQRTADQVTSVGAYAEIELKRIRSTSTGAYIELEDVPVTPPNPPTALTCSVISSTQIDLLWTDNSLNETSFRIERSPDGVAGWVEIGFNPANDVTYSDTPLTPNTQYCYRVKARNAAGDSAYTNVECCVTFDVFPPPVVVISPIEYPKRPHYGVQGLVVHINQSLFISSANRESRSRTYVSQITGYGHEIGVDGGFLNAQIGLKIPLLEAEDLWERGLGKNVLVRSNTTEICFHGFINTITLNMGSLSAEQRGPLIDTANRLAVSYTIILDDGDPPATGGQTITTLVQNTDSQGRFGIWEKIFSGGTCKQADAELLRNQLLAEMAYPTGQGDIQLGGTTDLNVSLEVLGYIYALEAAPYTNTGSNLVTITDKIKAVKNADPNNIISTNDIFITDNAYLVHEQEVDYQFGWQIIKGLTALGDINNNRYIAGIYENRILRYEPVEMTIGYVHYIGATPQVITDRYGKVVEPWLVRPGKWVLLADFNVGDYANPITAPGRANLKFAESVRFEAPNSLTIMGGKVGKVAQMMAKLGLGGM